MKAEREKRAVILESEGVRDAQVNRAQGEKQSAVLRAEGHRDAAIAEAMGQAKAIQLVADEIGKAGGEKAVQLEVAKAAIAQYGHLAKEGTSLVLMGDAADPKGWIAQAMALLKSVNSSPVGSSGKQ